MTTESMTMKTQENSAEVGIDVQRLVRDALRYRAIKKKIDYSEGDDGEHHRIIRQPPEVLHCA